MVLGATRAHAVEKKRSTSREKSAASDLKKSWENLGNPITRLLTGWQSGQRKGCQAGRSTARRERREEGEGGVVGKVVA